jgi:hypothetical protein
MNLKFYNYKGQYVSLLFFVSNYKYSYDEIYVYHGHILDTQIIFPQSLHFQHTFSTFAKNVKQVIYKSLSLSLSHTHTH